MHRGGNSYSKIELDQGHEQNNRTKKSRSELEDQLNKEEKSFSCQSENIMPEIIEYLQDVSHFGELSKTSHSEFEFHLHQKFYEGCSIGLW